MNFALLVFAYSIAGLHPNHVEVKQVTFETRELCEEARHIIAEASAVRVTGCFQIRTR